MKKPNGFVIYDGPSLMDGKPIVVVAITKSSNTKTGNEVQTIIMRSDIDPITGSRTGEDFTICGNCIHRGIQHDGDSGGAKERSCYVMLLMVLSVFKAYKKGLYPSVVGKQESIVDIGRSRVVRLGSYGDPAVVPSETWDTLLLEADGHTGYSHQSGMPSVDYRPDLTMTSVDTLEQAEEAWGRGERTFRVTYASSPHVVKEKEVSCPASEEAGRRTTCEDCLLCSGNTINAKSIVIMAHGAGKKHYALHK